ncbi:hypothetical protein [Pseudenterobacter timonensis]|uniref:Uncharacterized protein n=1 Tax=Pseudenterobacter timonensis TaxID=1755099 RepID=A0ABV4A9V1_9ENTR
MACRSASVERVADKTVSARDQIEKLQKMIASQNDQHTNAFQSLIGNYCRSAKITDARIIGQSSDVKTEYASEFSIDKMANVVVKVLEAAAAVKNPNVENPATSPEALKAYTNVVNSVAEAAKSKSSSAANLAFSATRLVPGIIAFLYAASVNLKDEETFGSETVTTTAIYYQIVESIDDLTSQAAFDIAIIQYYSIVAMKKLQALLVESLARKEISLIEWKEQNANYSQIIKEMQEQLSARSKDKAIVLGSSSVVRSIEKQKAKLLDQVGVNEIDEILDNSISQLQSMGPEFADAASHAQKLKKEDYFTSIE